MAIADMDNSEMVKWVAYKREDRTSSHWHSSIVLTVCVDLLLFCSRSSIAATLSRLLLCGRRSAPGQTCADRWRRQLCVLVVLRLCFFSRSLSRARLFFSCLVSWWHMLPLLVAFDHRSVIAFLYKQRIGEINPTQNNIPKIRVYFRQL